MQQEAAMQNKFQIPDWLTCKQKVMDGSGVAVMSHYNFITLGLLLRLNTNRGIYN